MHCSRDVADLSQCPRPREGVISATQYRGSMPRPVTTNAFMITSFYAYVAGLVHHDYSAPGTTPSAPELPA